MQLQCRNSWNDMEALKTKDKIEFYTNLKTTKNSAKRVTVAQQECHLAQFSGVPVSGTVRFLVELEKHRTSNIER